jgi:hypothetical protein
VGADSEDDRSTTMIRSDSDLVLIQELPLI